MHNLSYFIPIFFSNSNLAYNVCKNVILRQLFCTHTNQNFHYTLEFINIHSFFVINFLNHTFRYIHSNGKLRHWNAFVKTLLLSNLLQWILSSFNAKEISNALNRNSFKHNASFFTSKKKTWSHRNNGSHLGFQSEWEDWAWTKLFWSAAMPL